VRYVKVEGCTIARLFSGWDSGIRDALIAAGEELVAAGAQLITSNCGFTIRYQAELSDALGKPVILSSLLQIPLLTRALGSFRVLGVVTASAEALTDEVLGLAGVTDPKSLAVCGLEDAPAFRSAMIDCVGEANVAAIEDEVVDAALKLLAQRTDVGAMLLECSELPPYAAAVQNATGLPVFDFLTMIEHFGGALTRRPYFGFY